MPRFTFAFVCAAFSVHLLIFLNVILPAHAQQAQPTAIAVGTVAAERKAIARSGVFVGRVEAVQRVEVRARVTGYLEEVLFKEGDLINEGAPLYRIEKGLFEAAVAVGGSRSRAKQSGQDSDRGFNWKERMNCSTRIPEPLSRETRLWLPINRHRLKLRPTKPIWRRRKSTSVTPISFRRSRERLARPTSPREMSLIPTAVC